MNNKKVRDKRINFEIPEELHKVLKVAAASDGLTIKVFILRLIIEELKNMGYVKVN